jgi:FAD/FMN-containing dehydrogenase
MGGAKWGDVYKTLQPYGVAVTGGRSDTVGVGGFIIGGGLSYFGNKYGLACDNVLNFEVSCSKLTLALANG